MIYKGSWGTEYRTGDRVISLCSQITSKPRPVWRCKSVMGISSKVMCHIIKNSKNILKNSGKNAVVRSGKEICLVKHSTIKTPMQQLRVCMFFVIKSLLRNLWDVLDCFFGLIIEDVLTFTQKYKNIYFPGGVRLAFAALPLFFKIHWCFP